MIKQLCKNANGFLHSSHIDGGGVRMLMALSLLVNPRVLECISREQKKICRETHFSVLSKLHWELAMVISNDSLH